jgi:Flp pilus assembly protein TadD
MRTKPSLGALAASTLLVGLGACSHLPQLANWGKAKPMVTTADMRPVGMQAASDRLYADAVQAIDKRDYGEAIDLLQVAREAHPADARVLTAMGVVYDKLGRFDLSDRYYAQADKADPGSRIVALDRRYSMVLRGAGKVPPGGVAIAVAQAAPAAQPAAAPAASRAPTVPAQPVRLAKAARPVTGDDIYAQAVASIERHEYGVALGELRAARDAMPGDARVLTALAVTYDHLGRFDLSSRYYDQAEKADPGSVVVAQDRHTSLILQQHGGFDGPDDVIVLAKAAPGAKGPLTRRVASAARPAGNRA